MHGNSHSPVATAKNGAGARQDSRDDMRQLALRPSLLTTFEVNQMRTLIPVLLLAVLGKPGELQAQNLVKNGDFSATTIAPWTSSGFALNPGLEKFNTSGTATSVAYANNPGGRTGPPPFPPHILQQGKILLVPVVHELSFDLAAFIPRISFTAAVPKVEVFIDKLRIFTMTFSRIGVNPRRLRPCIRFTPTITGVKTLRFEFSWAGVARASFTPRVYLDNVSLRRTSNPTFCIRGERRLGTTVEFGVQGSPKAAFVIFLAAKLAARPLAIPGIAGLFRLDLSTVLPILSGTTDRNGAFTVRLPIPKIPGLGGKPLFWQGIEITNSAASFGLESLQGFYD